LNSRERILSAFYLEEPDKVPVSLYMGLYWLNWVSQDTFWFFIRETDAIVRVPLKYDGIFLTSTPKVRIFKKTYKISKNRLLFETIVRISDSELKQVAISENGITWIKEPFIKSDEDIEIWLSIPYEPVRVYVNEYFYYDKKINKEGLTFLSFSDPIGHLYSLFSKSLFMVNIIKKRKIMEDILNIIWERFEDLLVSVLEKGALRLWLSGPEHLCPTFFNPKYFDIVVKYDKKVAKLIHEYDGIYYMHCHGRIKQILNKFKLIGIDALDTIDPPPQGDCDLETAKKVLGDTICLLGNVSSVLMAQGSPCKIKSAVKSCIEKGALGGGYVLQPTSGTIVDVPIKNLLAFVKAGRKYGMYYSKD